MNIPEVYLNFSIVYVNYVTNTSIMSSHFSLKTDVNLKYIIQKLASRRYADWA